MKGVDHVVVNTKDRKGVIAAGGPFRDAGHVGGNGLTYLEVPLTLILAASTETWQGSIDIHIYEVLSGLYFMARFMKGFKTFISRIN